MKKETWINKSPMHALSYKIHVVQEREREKDIMEKHILYAMLELPCEVVQELNNYGCNRKQELVMELQNRILDRTTWDEAIKELQALLDDDPKGLKILWELLNIACMYSYENYQKRNIPDNIFVATMKFCTRFLGEYYRTYGEYRFVWSWWYPRQLSLNEFRIGALEYELVEGDVREISIHIPSDADLSRESVLQSIKDFDAFRRIHFPQWENVMLVCDSWMLAPTLKKFLDETSNILAFQNMFEIDKVDEEATWFMDWIYPGCDKVDENLPEKTSLQRRMKTHLLEGKKVGVAKGHLKSV